jgi:hypothetical protein
MSHFFAENISGRDLPEDGVKIDSIIADSSLDNAGVGTGAGASVTTGISNVFLGVDACGSLTTGSRNTAAGYNAAGALIGGNNNCVYGENAMPSATSASSCVVVGRNAAAVLTTGNSNVVVGPAAAGNLVSGASNTVLGSTANVSSATAANRIAIGAGASATADSGLFFPTGLANTGGAGVPVRYVAASGLMGPESSSARFKENISELEVDSEVVYDLAAKSYNFIAEKSGVSAPPRVFGYIAEEVVELVPEVVGKDAEGRAFGVNYDMLVVLAIEELKKLREEIAEIREKMQES